MDNSAKLMIELVAVAGSVFTLGLVIGYVIGAL